VGIVSVVHPALVEAVAESVPLRRALERHDHHVVAEPDAAGKLDSPGGAVGSRDHHPMDRIEAARLTNLRPLVVERNGEREHGSAFHETGGAYDEIGRDVIEG